MSGFNRLILGLDVTVGILLGKDVFCRFMCCRYLLGHVACRNLPCQGLEERFRAWFFDSALIEKVFKIARRPSLLGMTVYRDVMSMVKISLSWPENLKSWKFIARVYCL